MRDFFDILTSMGLYEEAYHNKTDREYILHDNLVEFVSMDQPQKKRGMKRDYLWLNEANEFSYEEYFQFLIRTGGLIELDYNPSDEYHWIYDKVLPRKDCRFIQSTYRDNIRFLPKSITDEIESLKELDPNYWKIYGLGERGQLKSLVYSNWDLVDEFPDNCDEVKYGVDFGFNNPSAVIKVGIKDKYHAYIDECLYETRLTNNDLIDRLNQIEPQHQRLLKADSAEPDRIEELQRAGFWVEGAQKGKNSVKDGIDVVKRFKLHITRRSQNVQKEIKSYKWREDKDGRIMDEPIAFFNHAMDCVRYAIGDMEQNELRIW